MRLGMMMSYAGGFSSAVDELVDYESAGLDIVLVPEAYSFDAVSLLGFVAARTTRLQLASGIMQLYTRTPTLTAMTAAGLDYVSGGRFNLGLGASGPQVIEGFHGVPYDAPLARTREMARQTPESRNRYVDFLRAASIMVVVFGHWLMAGAYFGADGLEVFNLLTENRRVHYLTWILQVMPIFFLVRGSKPLLRVISRTLGRLKYPVRM